MPKFGHDDAVAVLQALWQMKLSRDGRLAFAGKEMAKVRSPGSRQAVASSSDISRLQVKVTKGSRHFKVARRWASPLTTYTLHKIR